MASFFFQAEDGIRDIGVTGVQTCALPIYRGGDPAPEGIRLGAAAASGSRRAHQGRAACGRRSEERRVGKECRCRWWPHREKKQKQRGGNERGESKCMI